MRDPRRIGAMLAVAALLVGVDGCFYKSTEITPKSRDKSSYYDGMSTASPWYGFPYGPPGYYPSDVYLGGGRLGGRY